MPSTNEPERPEPGGERDPRVDQTFIVQAELIRNDQYGLPEVAIFPDGRSDDGGRPLWHDGIDYLARRGYVLVRTVDVPRVSQVLAGAPVERGDDSGYVDRAGVTLYSYQQQISVEQACQVVDAALGVGVATPDHLLYLVSNGGTCPATEPEPVPTPTRPYPEPPRCADDGKGVAVWVLDSGLLDDAVRTHPWMANVTCDPGDEEQPYFANDPTRILPYAGHGTFSAGVVSTMAPGARVMVKRTFVQRWQGTGKGPIVHTNEGFFESDLIDMVHEALDRRAQVLSLAFGTHSRKDIPLLSIDQLEPLLANREDVVLVAAAGNDSSPRPFWPAAYPWVVSVGALNRNWDARAWFTNFGRWVQVYAPGEDLVNAYLTSGHYDCVEPANAGQRRDFFGMARWSGTSFSTPMVAGLVARRMSHTREQAVEAAEALLACAPYVRGVGKVLLPDASCGGCSGWGCSGCGGSSCGGEGRCGPGGRGRRSRCGCRGC